MQVVLEEITFNHDTDSATCDAFNIRRNETQAVTLPEWRRGISVNPEDSPAAYARNAVRNQTVTVKAKFSSDSPGEKVWIRAVDGRLEPVNTHLLTRLVVTVLRPLFRRFLHTNVLGKVSAKQVEFMETETDMLFELQDARIEQAAVGIDDIVWHWQFSDDGRNWNPIGTTLHRIYTVLDLPGRPWQPDSNSSNTQLPWTSVLDHSCRWAAGTTDLEAAAFQITEAINSLGSGVIRYDLDGNGAPHYAKDDPPPPKFDCQKFLNLLNSGLAPVDPLVNCDDCAAMVCTFANVLGCSFPESEITFPGHSEFSLRRHQKIGLDWENFDQFGHHIVAWAGADQDPVSDACLKLDGSDSNSSDPIPTIASNLPFAGKAGYRERLVLPGEKCKLKQQFSRRVGLAQPERSKEKREALSLLDAFSRLPSIGGWTLVYLRYVPDDSVEIYLELTEGPNKLVLRLDIQVSATKEHTDANLMHKLTRFELPGVKLKTDAGFDGKVFANQSGFVILFSRNQMVVLLRNVGTKSVPLWEIARLIDKFFLSLPTMKSTADTSEGGY